MDTTPTLLAPSINPAAMVTFLQEAILLPDHQTCLENFKKRLESTQGWHYNHALKKVIGEESPIVRIKVYMGDVLHVNAHSHNYKLDELAEYLWELTQTDHLAAALMIINSKKLLESHNHEDLIKKFVLPKQSRTVDEQKLLYALFKYLIWHSMPKNLRITNGIKINRLAHFLPHLAEEPTKLLRVLQKTDFATSEENSGNHPDIPKSFNDITNSAMKVAVFLKFAILAGSKAEVQSSDEEVEIRINWLLQHDFEIEKFPALMITDPIRNNRCIQFIQHVLPKLYAFPDNALLKTLISFLLAIPINWPLKVTDLKFLAGAIFAVSKYLAEVKTQKEPRLIVRDLEPLHVQFIFEQFIIRVIAPIQRTPDMHITIPAPYSAIKAIGHKSIKVETIYEKFLEECLGREPEKIKVLVGVLLRLTFSSDSKAKTLIELVWNFNDVLEAYLQLASELNEEILKQDVLTNPVTFALFLKHVVCSIHGKPKIFAGLAHFVLARKPFNIPLKEELLLGKGHVNSKTFLTSVFDVNCLRYNPSLVTNVLTAINLDNSSFDSAAQLFVNGLKGCKRT